MDPNQWHRACLGAWGQQSARAWQGQLLLPVHSCRAMLCGTACAWRGPGWDVCEWGARCAGTEAGGPARGVCLCAHSRGGCSASEPPWAVGVHRHAVLCTRVCVRVCVCSNAVQVGQCVCVCGCAELWGVCVCTHTAVQCWGAHVRLSHGTGAVLAHTCVCGRAPVLHSVCVHCVAVLCCRLCAHVCAGSWVLLGCMYGVCTPTSHGRVSVHPAQHPCHDPRPRGAATAGPVSPHRSGSR